MQKRSSGKSQETSPSTRLQNDYDTFFASKSLVQVLMLVVYFWFKTFHFPPGDDLHWFRFISMFSPQSM